MLPPQTPAESTRRILFAVFISIVAVFALNACTVKARTIEPGTIPKIEALAPGEAEYGKRLFDDLCDDYPLEPDPARAEGLVTIFDNLIEAAEADHLPWHLYLFDDPDIIDIRAVHGNYVFVWSGFLEAAENDDEIAALMACEIAHVLARHTYPVQFTLWTDLFFDVAEMATSLAIMSATQGMVAISGQGWMKWAYVELADLDALDREYSSQEEREATLIAILIMERARYSPEAMRTFWQRVEQDEDLSKRANRLRRDLSPQKRFRIIDEFLPLTPTETEANIPGDLQTSQHDVNAVTPRFQ
ncbi:MAG: M48 family metalloprotease [Deltaproteobacteria bacterium]|nr:M48 family metalloprotease [Deltaproteobacteria bacterium]